ncbi:helix-turn-helix domain-containing protein [Novosphingobium sp. 1949]|uniref:Helix-turn-helix domain-containing protein n=1 Tax=Novosphingobium organovorum TaxID=2930092 RepID=A0ABT0BGI8_9SPHN|nr:helix-turn-helix transcriptional regulator [Novosphingobium organovorum]MCJ2183931.1 helix-turn-helix domain-containing protein [Novosphingobium organovorum]
MTYVDLSLIVGGLISDIHCLSFLMEDIKKRLGKNVATLRKAQGMSQETFADHAGIHRTYISDVERGARNPTIEIVAKIAKALNVTPGQLLDWPETPEN